VNSPNREIEQERRALVLAFASTFGACVVTGLAAGSIAGEPVFQPVGLGFLAVFAIAFALAMLTAVVDDRRPSKRVRLVGAVLIGVFLRALVAVFVVGPIGSANQWLPPVDCSLGGCGG
jgi:hypothetical protein